MCVCIFVHVPVLCVRAFVQCVCNFHAMCMYMCVCVCENMKTLSERKQQSIVFRNLTSELPRQSAS